MSPEKVWIIVEVWKIDLGSEKLHLHGVFTQSSEQHKDKFSTLSFLFLLSIADEELVAVFFAHWSRIRKHPTIVEVFVEGQWPFQLVGQNDLKEHFASIGANVKLSSSQSYPKILKWTCQQTKACVHYLHCPPGNGAHLKVGQYERDFRRLCRDCLHCRSIY